MKTIFKLFFFLVPLGPGSFVLGQNLVINPSFEELIKCPDNSSFMYGAIIDAENWFNPNTATADLFSPCASHSTSLSAPDNGFGYQQARTGDNYAGIYVFQSPEIRDYAQGTLSTPLLEGAEYCVKFYVSLAEIISRLSIRTLGVYFSSDKIQSDVYTRFEVVPQIVLDPGLENLITDWIPMEGSFVAQGGERFITIGNFSPDALSDTIFVHEINDPSVTGRWSYFYLDDVSVELCSSPPPPAPIPYSGEDSINFANTLTNESFVIQFFSENKIKLNGELYNSVGQLVKNFNISDSMTTIPVYDLATGIYYCRVRRGNEIIKVQKIIKAN